ncbi:MAG: choice-of-anchor J domain-containing protein [Myxococcales bacterium]|nr:choice-of-anchor J domain-containing protein [Myxococcales bacterium]
MRCIPYLVAASMLLLVACGDSGDTPNSDTPNTNQDGGADLPPGTKLEPCSNPGGACNPHDPCAINPTCGQDGLCRPQSYQNCDDGLDCTTDTCLGQGKCENMPKDGTCALPVKGSDGTSVIKCFNKDDRESADGCRVCDPDKDKVAWSPANGGACDDGDSCTKDDYCNAGTCQGTDFRDKCQDNLSCTEDICDGKGGCVANKLMADSCLINGQCYKGKERDATGCNECDPSKSTTAWTALTLHCLVGGKCYTPGEKDSTGCAECDPSKSTTAFTPLSGVCTIDSKCYQQGDKFTSAGTCAECSPSTNATGWTVTTNNCLVDGKCVNPGDKDSTGCAACDPTKSKTAYSPLTNKCLIGKKCYDDAAGPVAPDPAAGCLVCSYAGAPGAWTKAGSTNVTNDDFENNMLGGYVVANTSSTVGWQVSNRRAGAGTYSIYYGNPTTGDYDDGFRNSGTLTTPSLTLTAGKKAGLRFWIYLDVELDPLYDNLDLKISGTSTVLWSKSSISTYRQWVEVVVDLSAHAGKTIKLEWSFDTQDEFSNSDEGVFIDNITFYEGC